MAASSSYSRLSSSAAGSWTYDVFLSFRGLDTRNFLEHLYTALEIRGIYTFKDDERLLTGEPISQQLSAAIKESRFAVVVFSKNYANSAWCLDELVHISDCRKEIGQTVIPVFYKVDPSVVRKQLRSFGVAFKKHEKRYESEKIKRWKEALVEIAGLSGFDVTNTAHGSDSKCIKKIVQEISNKCRKILNCERNLVGIFPRVEDLKSLLGTDLDVVRFAGIWGIGGSGKTTLAWAVYKEISYQFEAKSFVENVKEISKQCSGLQLIQQKILSEVLLDKSMKVNGTHEGLELMGSRLRRKKVLIVLDDVDDDTQLDALAASHEWFGRGSRIIITTRDQRWLIRPTLVEMYNVSLLSHSEALKLFSLHAFGKDSPPNEYRDDSDYLVRKSGGFPLALKVLGASLYNSTMKEWKSTLRRLEVEGKDEVSKMLKVCYDGLSEIDQKILLDIACFFKGEKADHVIRILDSFDFHAHFGIKRLIQKSLIFVSNSRIHMHDRIQEMGWHIVGKSSGNPRRRNRLWLPDNVRHALSKNRRKKSIEGISIGASSELITFEFDAWSFRDMNKLRLLVLNKNTVPMELGWLSKANKYISSVLRSSKKLECLCNLRWLTWSGYRFKSLAGFLVSSKLVGLELPYSDIVRLWDEGGVLNGRKSLDKLRFINLTGSDMLRQTPDLNMTPNLHTLNLEGCINLVDVHPSIGDHGQLVFLSFKDCYNLQNLPSSIGLKSLETLILSGCLELRKFPDVMGNMKMLSKLYLDCTSIEELPMSIGNLSALVLMDLTLCKSLKTLPSEICELKSLKTLYASFCQKLEKLPENIGQIQSLEEIWLNNTPIREAPSSMGLLKNLKTFSLGGCNLSDGEIPEDLSSLSSLEELNLSYNLFKKLPQGISYLPRLKILDVSGCKNLEAFEAHLPSSIAVLKADWTAKSANLSELSIKYDSLWKISCINHCVPAEKDLESDSLSVTQSANRLLESLLQGQLVANHRFSLLVSGCHIPQWFWEKRPKSDQQQPMNYKEDIVGFAIATVSSCYCGSRFIDIQFDLLLEERNTKWTPHKCHRYCHDQKLWVGFFSFNFFKHLFPQIQPDNWSTFTSKIGVSIVDEEGHKMYVAHRPVCKEDVPEMKESAKNDAIGLPWFQHYINDEDICYIVPKCRAFKQRSHPFSSNTAYLKERGDMHARLVISV